MYDPLIHTCIYVYNNVTSDMPTITVIGQHPKLTHTKTFQEVNFVLSVAAAAPHATAVFKRFGANEKITPLRNSPAFSCCFLTFYFFFDCGILSMWTSSCAHRFHSILILHNLFCYASKVLTYDM